MAVSEGHKEKSKGHQLHLVGHKHAGTCDAFIVKQFQTLTEIRIVVLILKCFLHWKGSISCFIYQGDIQEGTFAAFFFFFLHVECNSLFRLKQQPAL